MYKIIKPQTHEGWLDARKGGIGSSEVATILGLNPFESPYQLWQRKLGMTPPKEETFIMKAGHYLEDAVAMFFRDETGAHIVKASAGDWIMQDTERPYLQASPDRTFWRAGEKHNEANKGILEIKTTRMKVSADDLPLNWFCQLQYQLGIAGMQHGALAWLTMGSEFDYAPMEFDAEFYAYMCDRVEQFWKNNILGRQEPDLTCVEDVLLKYPKEMAGKTLTANDTLLADIQALREIKQQAKELDARKGKLEDAIKLAMQDSELLVDETGGKLATYKAAKDSMVFDKDRFKAEHADLYAEYQKQQQGSRRLLIK